MSEENEVRVLYRNHQWMVRDEPKGHFIVEVSEHDLEDTESGYWIGVEDLKIVRDGWNMIEHVCEKTWVDIDAYEGAVKAALMLFGIRPNYDVAAKFREARRADAEAATDDTTAETLDLTDDERDLILQMRKWKDGIPEDAISQSRKSAVYVRLVAARAELFKMAIRHKHNDVFAQHDRIHELISPFLLLELCKAWEDLRDRERQDEYAELFREPE